MYSNPPNLQAFFSIYQERINQILAKSLPTPDPSSVPHGKHLYEAMRYSLLLGGKRIRPLLAYAAAYTSGEINPSVDQAACAVECIHAYSLIHDDLPAMDDDDLRRGKATCHIAFDEATAILAGDALQTLAFSILSSTELDSVLAVKLIRELSQASGANVMVVGQALDLRAANRSLDLRALEAIHLFKTGALIEAAIVMGALAGGCSDTTEIDALRQYAKAIGLAFQVRDDILDVTADTQTLGKTQGADEALKKSTYVSLLGLEEAEQHCERLLGEAILALKIFDDRADYLRQIARFIVNREF